MISITFDDHDVMDYLRRSSHRLGDMQPALADIGELLAETTKRRFDTSTGPDGQPWSSNSDATILQYLGHYHGSFLRTGDLSAKGKKRSSAKKPLIGETRSLSSTIYYQLGSDSVAIGSPLVYSAMQQFGGAKSEYPHLWGDIPARPYLGLSDDDCASILDILESYLSPA